MNRQEIEEQAALDALGLLDDNEHRDFIQQLVNDPESQRLSRDFRGVVAGLAVTVDQVEPPISLKEKVFAALPDQRLAGRHAAAHAESGDFSDRPTSRTSTIIPLARYIPWAIAAGLALVCGLLVQNNTQLRTQVAELEDQGKMDSLRIAVLSSMLQGSPDARAVAVWNSAKQEGVLTVEGLPPIPQDKDYQLWVIDPHYENPVDGGVFRTDSSGRFRHVFHPQKAVSSANVFAVSLEREGGVPKAEGPMVLISSR